MMAGEGAAVDSTKPAEGAGVHETTTVTTTNTATKDLQMADSQPISGEQQELIQKVQALLEFYFGDANLSRDRFLRKSMEADPEEYVHIDVLCTFNKLKELTTDTALIAQAAQSSQLLALDASRKRIKRTTALPDNHSADRKTIYAELYPLTYTREMLEELFSKCGQVTYISIPKKDDAPRGFAFIEYETQDMVKEAVKNLNTINNPTHFPEAPKGMRVMSKDTWYRFRDELKELKQRLSDSQKVHNLAPEPGLIVFFGNVGPDMDSRTIKMQMKALGPLAYVEYDPETRTGHARFKHPKVAQDACKRINAERFQLGGREIVCRVITGNEEQEYWKLIHANAARKKQSDESNRQNYKKDYNNNNNKHNNNRYNNNNNNNNNNQNTRKHQLTDSKGEGEGESKDTNKGEGARYEKKQKRQNKDVKVKGKKIPSIAKAKPKSHVIFGDDGEETEVAKKGTEKKSSEDKKETTKDTETNTENTEGENRKRAAGDDDSSNDTKRLKSDPQENK